MTISNNDNKVIYTADGVIVDYTYTFRADNDSDMQVYLGETLQSTGYTIVRNGDNVGGTVTFDAPPANLTEVTLLRVIPLTQGTDYQPYDAFPAEAHEDALDKLTMISQQLDERLTRVPEEPIGSPDPGFLHSSLTGRDVADSHPIAAVTNLTTTLSDLNTGVGDNKADITTNTSAIQTNASDIAAMQDPIGVFQTWQDMMSSRASGIIYTNDTGRPIMVSVSNTGQPTEGYLTFYIEGVAVAKNGSASVASGAFYGSVQFIIPAGNTYQCNAVGAIQQWAELR